MRIIINFYVHDMHYGDREGGVASRIRAFVCRCEAVVEREMGSGLLERETFNVWYRRFCARYPRFEGA